MIITASDFFSRAPADLPPAEEDAFFSGIRNRNSTFKRTHAARFADIDRDLVRLLKGRAAPLAAVLDVAVSSGATTLDLQSAMARAGFHPRFTGTDIGLQARLLRLGRACSVLVSSDGHPLQLALGRWSVRPWRRRLDWLTGMWAVRPLLFAWAAGRMGPATSGRPVLLVSPRLRNHPSIGIVEDDILLRRPEFGSRFDVIRAANILNLDYFTQEQLRSATANLLFYLAGPGSLLLVVRSHNDGEQHGTLFELDPGGSPRVVRRYGMGSEIEQLVLAG